MSFVRFAPLSEIPPGRNKSLRIGLRKIAVFNVGGTLYAVEDACAHMRAPLSQGRLIGTDLTCTWHGWTYDLASGRRKGKEAICVRTYPVKIEGETVLVDTAEREDPGGRHPYDEEPGGDGLPDLF